MARQNQATERGDSAAFRFSSSCECRVRVSRFGRATTTVMPDIEPGKALSLRMAASPASSRKSFSRFRAGCSDERKGTPVRRTDKPSTLVVTYSDGLENFLRRTLKLTAAHYNRNRSVCGLLSGTGILPVRRWHGRLTPHPERARCPFHSVSRLIVPTPIHL